MTPEDRALIVAIGQAARTCAMYRELIEVARRYHHEAEVERLRSSLAESDTVLSQLISQALNDDAPTSPAATEDPAVEADDAGGAEAAGADEPGDQDG
jgi:hypothetical protein